MSTTREPPSTTRGPAGHRAATTIAGDGSRGAGHSAPASIPFAPRVSFLRSRRRALRLPSAERGDLRLRASHRPLSTRLTAPAHHRRSGGHPRAALPPREVWDTLVELYRVALPRPGATPAAEGSAADAGSAEDAGPERHQPVQPELHVLLRVRRGQDRRHRRTAQPKFMSEETARESVDFMLARVGEPAARAPHVLRRRDAAELPGAQVRRVAYARQRAAELGKTVDFSLTTNATLLEPEIIDFLVENDIGVTISIDGAAGDAGQVPRLRQRRGQLRRGGAEGEGAAARHIAGPIGARVTLTTQTLDVTRIFRHLHRRDRVLGGRLRAGHHLAAARLRHRRRRLRRTCSRSSACWPQEFLRARRSTDRHHGFSNVRETLDEIHKGVAQGLPLRRRPRPDGRGDRRRRGAVPPLRRLGRAQLRHRARRHRPRDSRRLPRRAPHRQQDRLPDLLGAAALRGRLLSRGPHALRRHGAPNLHYCDWIRGWTAHLPGDLRRAGRAQPRTSCAQFDPERGRMKHLKAVNRKAARVERITAARAASCRPTQGDVVALQQRGTAAAARRAAHPARLLARLLAGLGSRPHGRHRRALPAGGARPLRLPRQLLLAGAGARPAATTRPTGPAKCAAAQKDWRKIDLIFPECDVRSATASGSASVALVGLASLRSAPPSSRAPWRCPRGRRRRRP